MAAFPHKIAQHHGEGAMSGLLADGGGFHTTASPHLQTTYACFAAKLHFLLQKLIVSSCRGAYIRVE